MRDWHTGSFTWKNGFDTPSLRKLDEIYFLKPFSMSETKADFFENMRNMLVKYGFMQHSRDLLKNTIQGKQIETSYYLTNFISYTKAFLDSVAIVLNHFYSLNRTKGDIDLKHSRFLSEIKSKDPILGNYLGNNSEWIKKVVFLRDEVIHRKSPLHMYISPSDVNGNPKNLTVKMTMEPVTLFHFEEDKKRILEKHGKLEQDIIEFCENWLKKGEEFIENLSASLLRNRPLET